MAPIYIIGAFVIGTFILLAFAAGVHREKHGWLILFGAGIIVAGLILLAVHAKAASLPLHFTAVGDDSLRGTASTYDLRVSGDSITESSWGTAIPVLQEPPPRQAGTPESLLVLGLPPGEQLYFALKVADEVPNWSKLSNVVRKSVAGERVTSVGPDTVLVSPVADLIVSSIEHVPEPPNVAIRLRIANVGHASALSSYASIAIDGRDRAQVYTARIPPAGAVWTSWLHTAAPTRDYVISGCADCRNQVRELVESNNCTTGR